MEFLVASPRGLAAEAALAQDALVAPELIDAEVLSVLRRWVLRGHISTTAAEGALDRLQGWRVQRVPHAPLVRRAFALRNNYSAYDALYVAVAQVFQAPILTCDGPLARAPNLARVEIRNVG